MLNKKRFLGVQATMICLIMLLLLLTGCGGTESTVQHHSATEHTPAESNDKLTAESMPPAGEERTVKHAMGETKLSGTPQKVVVLTSEGTEALLALGVKPVGAVQSGLGDPWHDHIKDRMQGVEVLGDETQPNMELIASLKPDLILGNKVLHEKVYSQLSSMAPTVFSEDLAGDWKVNFRLYAEALNKKEEGDNILREFDQKVEQAKLRMGDKTKSKVSLVRFLPGKVRLYMKDTFAGVLLDQIGFARPASQDKDEFMEVISKERIRDMDGDILFYWVSDYDETKAAAEYKNEWMKDPLWQNLNVSKTNKVYQVDEVIWNTAGGVLAANLLLDELVTYFEAE
ncbi:iron-siderophore ABC transporter substrate-binding protein [Brevibacillus humidisoli]|uniref:ABC transporter substrate-binding protein n=1 Tax=Brevibacillus humidisoli TaxID=2895522 RepID=UPI001E56054B|nr:iron-siderophore ABC transporter substrate-binding protein [Brevibacillus humidisoli]UFJ39113.1 iron-siderophore ABC transporter substrate-binding protein [Brevibacillus humidisoli]